MNTAAVIFTTSAGGVVTLGAILALARGIFRQIAATDTNTAALRNLTGHLERVNDRMGEVERRVAVLEDRAARAAG